MLTPDSLSGELPAGRKRAVYRGVRDPSASDLAALRREHQILTGLAIEGVPRAALWSRW